MFYHFLSFSPSLPAQRCFEGTSRRLYAVLNQVSRNFQFSSILNFHVMVFSCIFHRYKIVSRGASPSDKERIERCLDVKQHGHEVVAISRVFADFSLRYVSRSALSFGAIRGRSIFPDELRFLNFSFRGFEYFREFSSSSSSFLYFAMYFRRLIL